MSEKFILNNNKFLSILVKSKPISVVILLLPSPLSSTLSFPKEGKLSEMEMKFTECNQIDEEL